MSSIGKSFKKAFKKVKKTTKKAVNKVADTTKDVADKTANAVTGAAQTVSNEVGREAQELARDVEQLTRDTARFAEKAYAEALEAGEAAWDATVELTERFLTDALAELAEELAEDICRDHRKLIECMVETGHELLKDPASRKDVERLLDAAAHKRRDEKTEKTTDSLSKNKSMNRLGAEARGKDLITLSVGTGGGAAFMAGAEGSVGFAYDYPNKKQLRGYFGVGGVSGFSIGTSMALQIGAWGSMPSNLDGPYLAVAVELYVKGGGGIQVVFSLPTSESDWLDFAKGGKLKLKLAGLVVSMGGGGEFSASVSAGYTWVY
ncbi:hypothetical protein [Archangium lipolyticum]|uniref:hypothetical protein n=1 Tax=Archangium lipolyticum TaxID=2970465 RepID=UPI00214A7CB9|nr:hypothetical protein [Archangium lipolyticum]